MNSDRTISRRGFLKTASAISASIAAGPALNAAEAVLPAHNGATNVKDGITYRTLGSGNAAMEVSAIGFGYMGLNYNRSQSPDRKECVRIIRKAVEMGISLFDTAIIYGPLRNELLAGEALAPFKGRVNLTTKFGHEVIDGKGTGRQDSSRLTVRRYCEESLRRLKLDAIPLFYQHRFDSATPIEEVAETAASLESGSCRTVH